MPSMESTMTSRSANGRRRICGPAKSAGHSVFENSAVGIALTDRDGFFAETNWAYEQLVGYTDKELRALSYSDITYEEDRPANRALAVALWEGKIPQFQYEKRYRRKDSKLVWVRTTVSLAAGTDTVPRFGMAIVQHITERKQAKEQLRRSEAYLAESQRLSHLGSCAMTISPREIVFCSQEANEIVMSEYAVLGPVDPQLGQYPAASILKAVSRKPVERVKDDTLILADQSEKAISQVRESVRELLSSKFPAEKAEELSRLLSEGTWTHDHPITYDTAKRFGLPVRGDIPSDFLDLMALYPQPVRRQPTVEYLLERRHSEGFRESRE